MTVKDYSHIIEDEKKREQFKKAVENSRTNLAFLKDIPPMFSLPGIAIGFTAVKETLISKQYDGKKVKDYSYFKKTKREFKKLFVDKFLNAKIGEKKISPEIIKIGDFFNNFFYQGLLLDNFDAKLNPDEMYKPSTIEYAIKKYADVHELIKKMGISYKKRKDIFKFAPSIRNAINHIDCELLKDKSICFYDTRNGKKLIGKMSAKEYRKMLKRIFLLYNAILAGFIEALSDKKVQQSLVEKSLERH